jgi:hypothetical protein
MVDLQKAIRDKLKEIESMALNKGRTETLSSKVVELINNKIKTS